jgi:hypothetical protein
LPTSSVLIDDRLLVAHLTGATPLLGRRSKAQLHTTTSWYYRACRAASLGGSGQLSGPFAELDAQDQARAIAAMLQLPDEIRLPEPRALVPAMVDLSARHPRLNVMNVEAAAAALLLGARVLLSPAAAEGVLAPVLDAERVRWDVHTPPA